MKKELRPVHDNVACDVCGRTILKGERTEPFLAPGGRRYTVCELCFSRAEHHGWIRESAAGDVPSRIPRDEPRRPLLGRLRRRREAEPWPQAPPGPEEPYFADDGQAELEDEEPHPPPPPPPRSLPRDPRHVRAVPTTAQVKVERALELFNGSEHGRTVVGLARTLGPPWITAVPDVEQQSEVTMVVAWELSWYRFRIDLGDEHDPVVMLEKGEEIEEIDDALREWNATMDADGRVVAGVGSEE